MRVEAGPARTGREARGAPRPLLVLVHGWGLGPSLWEPMLREPPLSGWEHVCVDLGFTGRPHCPPLPLHRPLHGVGHSLGFAWLLRQRLPWASLSSINGFPRFVHGADFPAGIPARVLRRMQRRLSEDRRQVVDAFLRRCGGGGLGEEVELHEERLGEGLRWLLGWDERQALRSHRGPLLALAGGRDAIVPPALSLASFPSERQRWQGEGGHLLPLSHPAWCAARLAESLEAR